MLRFLAMMCLLNLIPFQKYEGLKINVSHIKSIITCNCNLTCHLRYKNGVIIYFWV